MNIDYYLEERPFELPQKDKEKWLQGEMDKLTEYHWEHCQAYSDICNGIGGADMPTQSPYIPVSLFKDLELRSVPEEDVVRKVTSSGTTGQRVSKIYLDAETAAGQQRALCMITGDFIGGSRIPMLIIDTPEIARNRAKFSARLAGIMGFSMMASRRFYALDENMNIDWESIKAFQEAAAGGTSFAFGFTFIIWQYLYKPLADKQEKEKNQVLDLSNCHLIHGGGWKKLQNESVSDEEFRSKLKEVCNVKQVSDYYGMAEQTGSIFMQCEEGHLHASVYSDINILNPEDFTPCKAGEWGLVALESFLPKSYPGHKILTEDWGRILGTDDCKCGRKGKYFEIAGRIKKAEVRGCSDTFEDMKTSLNVNTEITLKCGTYPPKIETSESFSPIVKDFLDDLSTLITKTPKYRQYPEIYAFGFWIRQSHIKQLADSYADRGLGKGLGLHIAPSNMPTMFAYSWICSLMAGNSSVVRVSNKESLITNTLLEAIGEVLNGQNYTELKERNAFVQFPHESKALEELSLKAAFRVIWGGDETVKTIMDIPKSDDCEDIAFADKYSIGIFKASEILNKDTEALRHIAHMFYNDTYGADQNACSSPKTIFWVNDCDEKDIVIAKKKWWDAVYEEAKAYNLEPWISTEKYRIACVSYANNQLVKVDGNRLLELDKAKKWTNRLYVIPCKLMTLNSKIDENGTNANSIKTVKLEELLPNLEAKFGMFYEFDIANLEESFEFFGDKIQTIVSIGFEADEMMTKVRDNGCKGIDRIVAPGEALEFNTIWDRKDLIKIMSTEK